jgi:hypothetical protein
MGMGEREEFHLLVEGGGFVSGGLFDGAAVPGPEFGELVEVEELHVEGFVVGDAGGLTGGEFAGEGDADEVDLVAVVVGGVRAGVNGDDSLGGDVEAGFFFGFADGGGGGLFARFDGAADGMPESVVALAMQKDLLLLVEDQHADGRDEQRGVADFFAKGGDVRRDRHEGSINDEARMTSQNRTRK